MTETVVRDDLGQTIADHQLSSLAHSIASHIGDGRPARWAGFVWYRPQGLFQQTLTHRVEKFSLSKAA